MVGLSGRSSQNSIFHERLLCGMLLARHYSRCAPLVEDQSGRGTLQSANAGFALISYAWLAEGV